MVTWPVAFVIIYLVISAWVNAALVLINDKDGPAKGTSTVLTAFVLAGITPAVFAAALFRPRR